MCRYRNSLPRADGGDVHRWVCSAAIPKFALCSYHYRSGATVRMYGTRNRAGRTGTRAFLYTPPSVAVKPAWRSQLPRGSSVGREPCARCWTFVDTPRDPLYIYSADSSILVVLIGYFRKFNYDSRCLVTASKDNKLCPVGMDINTIVSLWY